MAVNGSSKMSVTAEISDAIRNDPASRRMDEEDGVDVVSKIG